MSGKPITIAIEKNVWNGELVDFLMIFAVISDKFLIKISKNFSR